MVNVEDFKGGGIYLSEFVLNKSAEYELTKIREDIKNVSWEDLKFSKSGTNIKIKLPQDIINKIESYNQNNSSYKELSDTFTMSIDDNVTNRTHTDGIDEVFRGLGLGYKMYKSCVKNLGHITSDDSASASAKKIWSYLIRDSEFYSILTDNDVLVIDKNLPIKNIEKIVKNFLTEHIDIPKKITKDWVRSFYIKDDYNTVYIDDELCSLFKDKKYNLLNWNFIKRYKSIKKFVLLGQYGHINSKYKNPVLNQKCYYMNDDIDDNNNIYEGKILSINIYSGRQISYNVDYNEGCVVASRKNIILAEEPDEKYNLNFKFKSPVYKKISDDCYICDYCDYVELRDDKIYFGLKRHGYEDINYLSSDKVKVKSIDFFVKGEKYIFETEKELFIAEHISVNKDKTKLYVFKYDAIMYSEYVSYDYNQIIYQENNKKKYIPYESIKNVYKMKKES